MIHPERELLQDTGQKTVPEAKKRKKRGMKSYLPIAVAFAGVLLEVGRWVFNSVDYMGMGRSDGSLVVLYSTWSAIGLAALKTLFLPALYLICRRLKCKDLRIIRSLQIVCWIVVIDVMLLNILSLFQWINPLIDLSDFMDIVGGGVSGTDFLIYLLNMRLSVVRIFSLLSSVCMVLSYGLCLIGFTQAKWEIYGRSNARGSMDVL